MPPPSCMVIHCAGHRSNPNHEVSITADGDEPRPAPVCTTHKRRIDQGEPWLEAGDR